VRRAKEDDFTARNFATIAPAAQELASATGRLAGAGFDDSHSSRLAGRAKR
jgi:hypothetical protein